MVHERGYLGYYARVCMWNAFKEGNKSNTERARELEARQCGLRHIDNGIKTGSRLSLMWWWWCNLATAITAAAAAASPFFAIFMYERTRARARELKRFR